MNFEYFQNFAGNNASILSKIAYIIDKFYANCMFAKDFVRLGWIYGNDLVKVANSYNIKESEVVIYINSCMIEILCHRESTERMLILIIL